MKGIDISSWQAGMTAKSINSVEFAILKVSEGTGWADPQFNNFYSMAKIPLGAYVYSHATTEADAIAEAKKALSLVNGRKLSLGIYMDVEEQKQLALRDSVLTAVVKAFCDTIKAGGYIAGAYGSAGNLWAKVGPSYLGDDVIVWSAAWGNATPKGADVWQYSAREKVSGYSGDVDGDKAVSNRFIALVKGTSDNAPQKPVEDTTEKPTTNPTNEPTQEPTTTTFSISRIPVLKNGDTGDAVKALQGELIAFGYSCGGKRDWRGAETPDGIFGNITQASVAAFQRKKGLKDSGIANKETRKALLGV